MLKVFLVLSKVKNSKTVFWLVSQPGGCLLILQSISRDRFVSDYGFSRKDYDSVQYDPGTRMHLAAKKYIREKRFNGFR